MGRRRQGINLKVATGLRVDADVKAALIRKYGTVQKWVDLKVSKLKLCGHCHELLGKSHNCKGEDG